MSDELLTTTISKLSDLVARDLVSAILFIPQFLSAVPHLRHVSDTTHSSRLSITASTSFRYVSGLTSDKVVKSQLHSPFKGCEVWTRRMQPHQREPMVPFKNSSLWEKPSPSHSSFERICPPNYLILRGFVYPVFIPHSALHVTLMNHLFSSKPPESPVLIDLIPPPAIFPVPGHWRFYRSLVPPSSSPSLKDLDIQASPLAADIGQTSGTSCHVSWMSVLGQISRFGLKRMPPVWAWPINCSFWVSPSPLCYVGLKHMRSSWGKIVKWACPNSSESWFLMLTCYELCYNSRTVKFISNSSLNERHFMNTSSYLERSCSQLSSIFNRSSLELILKTKCNRFYKVEQDYESITYITLDCVYHGSLLFTLTDSEPRVSSLHLEPFTEESQDRSSLGDDGCGFSIASLCARPSCNLPFQGLGVFILQGQVGSSKSFQILQSFWSCCIKKIMTSQRLDIVWTRWSSSERTLSILWIVRISNRFLCISLFACCCSVWALKFFLRSTFCDFLSLFPHVSCMIHVRLSLEESSMVL